MEPADLAREVSALLGAEVTGARSKSGGIILSVPGHSLQIGVLSPGCEVDLAECARNFARSRLTGN